MDISQVEILDVNYLEGCHSNIVIRAVLEQETTYLSIDYICAPERHNLPEFSEVCFAGK